MNLVPSAASVPLKLTKYKLYTKKILNEVGWEVQLSIN